MKSIEYRVRPVTRFVVTRYEENDGTGSIETLGEFPNEAFAERVAGAMTVAEPGSVAVGLFRGGHTDPL
jgi:hypothetical protein